MLLTDNIALRLREWLDRRDEEPDLVPRFRRVWKETPAARSPDTSPPRSRRRLVHRAALQPRHG